MFVILALTAAPAAAGQSNAATTSLAAATTSATITTSSTAAATVTTNGATTGATTGAAAAPEDWTIAQATAALTANSIARLPGAPAVMDESAVTAAIAGTRIKILLLPFAPLDPTVRAAVGAQVIGVGDWASGEQIELVTVQGLQVKVSLFNVMPSDLAEYQLPLAHADVTELVTTAIGHLKNPDADNAETPTIPLPAEGVAPAASLARIGDAMAATGVYSDPALPSVQRSLTSWTDVGPDRTIRAAFLPTAARGATLPDLLTPLHARFPGDIVVVVHGRWLQVAGPDPEILTSAVLWVYGNYQAPILGWDVQPAALVGVLAGRIGLLRTGVVTDQVAPAPVVDPVRSAWRWLPYLFGGIAVLLAAVPLANRFRRQSRGRRHLKDSRSVAADRRVLAGRLAAVAGQILELDGLALGAASGPDAARRDVTDATERYRVARDVLGDVGDLDVARAAIDEAERHLAAAARALRAPLAATAMPASPAGTGPS